MPTVAKALKYDMMCPLSYIVEILQNPPIKFWGGQRISLTRGYQSAIMSKIPIQLFLFYELWVLDNELLGNRVEIAIQSC